MKNSIVLPITFSVLFICPFCVCFTGNDGLKGVQYPLVAQPLFDLFNIPGIFKQRAYIKFVFKCIFFEGECDIIGRFLKPRAIAALFGECLKCTKYQEENVGDWLMTLSNMYPELWRSAITKFCMDLGLTVPEDEIRKMSAFIT